jgi:hypothetical protein
VLKELGEWLDDDRQWHQARGRHWVSLIDDLLKACTTVGPTLAGYLAHKADVALREIRGCKGGVMSGDSQAPDVSLRRRLTRAQRELADALGHSEALVAAWEDFVAPGVADERASRARTLLDLAEATGHDRKDLSRSLRALLADELLEVQKVRDGEISVQTPRGRAGLSADDRVELAGTRLRRLPRHGDVVVWLKYSLAPMRWPPVIEIGDRVTVFSVEWLRSVLCSGDRMRLPEEVRGDTFHLEMLVGTEEDDTGASEADQLREAVVRVNLDDVLVSQARDLASETSELLVSLASLHGAPPSIWQLTGDRIAFVNGRLDGASFGTPRFFAPSSEQRLELAQDDTAEGSTPSPHGSDQMFP